MSHHLQYTHHDGATPILIQPGACLDGMLRDVIHATQNRSVIVTDEHVAPLIQTLTDNLPHTHIIVIPAGECSKSRQMKVMIEDSMLGHELGRDTLMLAIGGGVVCDLAGFVAATYCRGIPHINVPTTVMAMVDAAIGGKNGINTTAGKNLLGSFKHPQQIIIDPMMLQSLPIIERANGLVECIKHTLLANADAFHWLSQHPELHNATLAFNQMDWLRIINDSVRIKAGIVSNDCRETNGQRQWLNLGHTIAHAIEQHTAFQCPHGQAVQIGLWMIMHCCQQMGYCSEADMHAVQTCLNSLPFPAQHALTAMDFNTLYTAMQYDKKAIANEPRYVLLRGIAEPLSIKGEYSFAVPKHMLEKAYHAWLATL